MDWDPALFVFAFQRVLAERELARERTSGAAQVRRPPPKPHDKAASATLVTASELAKARWERRAKRRPGDRHSDAPLAQVIPLRR